MPLSLCSANKSSTKFCSPNSYGSNPIINEPIIAHAFSLAYEDAPVFPSDQYVKSSHGLLFSFHGKYFSKSLIPELHSAENTQKSLYFPFNDSVYSVLLFFYLLSFF